MAQPGGLRRPLRGLEEEKTEQPKAVRPRRSDSSQQASSKPGAVQAGVELLKARGWVEGRNLRFEFRDATTEGIESAARQLVAAKVDLILCFTDSATRAASAATTTIPIVAMSSAPVELGLVKSLGRPGGNITGASFQAAEENGRVLELLREIRPGLVRVGVPANLDNLGWRNWFEGFERPGERAGIRIVALPLPRSATDIAPMLDAAAREQVQALVMPILPFMNKALYDQITAWAIAHKVVTRGPLVWREEAVLTFGANADEFGRLFISQVDRVLRGANPAETPFLQVTTWETIVNQRLARAVGWPVPRSLMLQATQVIE
jgi:putative ABC transport system substrate-binding protein